jgi:glyoxylase-like metal-dependent hydrolase (beta-lactamase superfamily II)
VKHHLPSSVQFIERDWLSSNMVLLFDGHGAHARATLVDSGYVKHRDLTVALVRHALAQRGVPDRALGTVVNTHLHSDHCGGNAALVRAFGCEVHVPEPLFDAVTRWDEEVLTYVPTGQRCERFRADGAVRAGEWLEMGGTRWQALAAPGHDPTSLIFYCPDHRGLISADALWENGFGIIFPELAGESGFAEQQAVLEMIASLDVAWVLPGHGGMFRDVDAALERAFGRLDAMRADPVRHARNAVKVLVKYQLLDVERATLPELLQQVRGARVMADAASLFGMNLSDAVMWAAGELVRQGKLRREGDTLFNRDEAVAAL